MCYTIIFKETKIMKNKKVKILSGICSTLVAFGTVSPCVVNATEPDFLIADLSLLSISPDDYVSCIRNRSAKEIFDEIKSRRVTLIDAENFIKLIKSNKKISNSDKIKLLSYFSLIDLLYIYCLDLKGLDMGNLDWEFYSTVCSGDSGVSKFCHSIGKFIEDNHFDSVRLCGERFALLRDFMYSMSGERKNINIKNVYNFFNKYYQSFTFEL